MKGRKNVVLAVVLGLSAGCGPLLSGHGPTIREGDRQERLVHASYDEVWAAALDALRESSFHIVSADESAGVIQASLRRPAIGSDQREIVDELSLVANFEPALQRGLRSVSEYWVRYEIGVAPVRDAQSKVAVAADIQAIDRSRGILVGRGFAMALPEVYPLESRGVLERTLFAEIGDRIYTGEEMLHRVGELGRD